MRARLQRIHQAHDALTYEAFGKSIHVFDAEVFNLSVSGWREPHFQRFSKCIKVVVDNVLEVMLQGGHVGEISAAASKLLRVVSAK